MAKADSSFQFTGTLHGITAYKRRDCEGIILRRKGGPTAQQIKNSKKFERTRENNQEFKGCSIASSFIKRALVPFKPIFDYNINAALIRPLSFIQKSGSTGDRGSRAIAVSKSPGLLSGFEFNKKMAFSSLLSSPIDIEIITDNRTAIFKIPAFKNNINFFPLPGFYVYRVVTSIAAIPDLVFIEGNYRPSFDWSSTSYVQSDNAWQVISEPLEKFENHLQLPDIDANGITIMASVGICFGRPGTNLQMEPVKYFGSGKILKVVAS